MTATIQNRESIVADARFAALSNYIVSATGMVYYASRPQALAGYVADRFEKKGLNDCGAYLRALQDDCDGELDELIALLTIGETHFFRHRELFDALRDVALPEIMERNRTTKRLRTWSAGCSTGPEAYSISILMRRELNVRLRDWALSILGTDINRPFLSQATEGRYEEWAFRGTSPELRDECFDEEHDSWRIAKRFRQGVTFQYHNLARHPFPSLVHGLVAFDLILCRNVLIYFAPEIAERILLQLGDCLSPGGWLAVGHAEHGFRFSSSLEAVSCCGTTLYRKIDGSAKTTSNGALRKHRGDANGSNVPSPVAQLPAVVRPRAASIGRPTETLLGGRVTTDHGNSVIGTSDSCKNVSPPTPDWLQVRTLADEGDVNGALKLCETLIVKNPLDPRGRFYQALLLDQTDGHEAAVQALNKAIYLDREFVLAHYYLGLTRRKLGDAAAAVKSFRNTLNLLEGHEQSHCFSDAEGMTVADLRELIQMHLEMLAEK